MSEDEVQAVIDLACEMAEDFSDEQIARLYLVLQGEAYDRKLTEQSMKEMMNES